MPTYTGGCHCGAVRFEVTKPEVPEGFIDCNCSICTKKGVAHFRTERDEFTLLQGEDALRLYQFNTATAKHWFCGRCGIHVYGVPRSAPDRLTVNARCLDDYRELRQTVPLIPFDGIHHPMDTVE